MRRVVLYGKPGCSLCTKVRGILDGLQMEQPFLFNEVDISANPAANKEYQDWIPVVLVDGREAMRGLPNEIALREALDLQL